MTIQVRIELEINEWGEPRDEDGEETLYRHITQSVTGGFDRQTWNQFQVKGKQPTFEQLELLAAIGDAVDKLAKTQDAVAARGE